MPYTEKRREYSVKRGGADPRSGAILKNGYRPYFRAGKIHRDRKFREAEQGAPRRLFWRVSMRHCKLLEAF